MGIIANQIKEKLTAALAPTQLDLVDQSAQHAGHSEQARAGESHFKLTIASAQFAGLSLLERHRLINGILQEELAGPVHALAIKIV